MCRVQGLGFRIGLGGLGFRVQDRLRGSGLRVQDRFRG